MAENTSGWERWLSARATVRERRGLRRSDALRAGSIDLASNDYLGLSNHPEVLRAAAETLESYGTGAGASRMASGTLAVHRELEAALCRYTHRDAALVFSSGYTANLGVLGSLGGPGSLFILDEHAHASLVDGARLSGAAVATAGHNDLASFRRLLQANHSSAHPKPRVLLAVESVYSVFGDAAPLTELAASCREFGALLLVDEAHSLAASESGSALRAAGLEARGQVITTATLSKSLGAQGGAVLFGGPAAAALREHLLNTARTFIFDTALAPAAAGGALAALRLADRARLAALARNQRLIRGLLAEYPELAGRVESGAGPIHSVKMPSAAAAVRAAATLAAQGIAVSCFRPPSVPDGISRIRLTAHAHQQPAELSTAIGKVARAAIEEES
ncbi:8-amino-7-oxononanoate synthase [Arthrobacter sp. MYb224]|uniref:aminotransferase class I/II-fold pyridoxal phosphate-dependent enzyme n=1 Tax=Micrococcaceae TaxID=1268 RepID=UPI000CFCB874|nr:MULTISPECIES: aminotransferase class I/II-fold pyridoxal phosphate-dependent enzyme [unclassified Arthrobacter]PQZ98136.1 8-amino-7-oxononanoate synthase [Arthrobacter sp. MYb224]PRA02457.1 8-amino-7-oxononanoate synthase [Arthrobacter sp. MYb229]PRB50600.1 8-amino-7-oxononanoate synthase [Arthrobacter sp. MYb216]